ncbi:microtubule-actin cross-linking factor 1, isoforms 6/7-like [Ammospiza nelsoni]|uniref:microtubule-actin cross-linking factor 1, isoforms 6/7-like n=1 Tax=Ammospiza nelsoni TaxID=2857394 RepID=UPI002869BD80|nr:microtubule-actin cross-linking factor 1, isoforms 6/7-like [Ammospiza nelsoni]
MVWVAPALAAITLCLRVSTDPVKATAAALIVGAVLSNAEHPHLGVPVCDLEPGTILASDPNILEKLKLCPALAGAQQDALNALLLSGGTPYGDPSGWDLQTLQDLGPLVLALNRTTLSLVAEAAREGFRASIAAAYISQGRSQREESLLLLRALAAASAASQPRLQRSTDHCQSEPITASNIEDIGLLFPEELDLCLSNDVLVENLKAVLDQPIPSEAYLVLKKKVDEFFQGSGIPDEKLRHLGILSRLYTEEEISQWKVTSSETLSALLSHSERPWSDSQVQQLLSRYLALGGSLTGPLLQEIGDRRLCNLQEGQIQQIPAAAIGTAGRLNISSCSQTKKDQLYRKAREAFASLASTPGSYYCQIQPYLGGAPAEDLKDLANAGVAINMDLSTFLALNPEELQKLSVTDVKHLLGENLPELKDHEHEPVVVSWVQQQSQQELDCVLDIGLQGGRPEPTGTASPAATSTATVTTPARVTSMTTVTTSVPTTPASVTSMTTVTTPVPTTPASVTSMTTVTTPVPTTPASVTSTATVTTPVPTTPASTTSTASVTTPVPTTPASVTSTASVTTPARVTSMTTVTTPVPTTPASVTSTATVTTPVPTTPASVTSTATVTTPVPTTPASVTSMATVPTTTQLSMVPPRTPTPSTPSPTPPGTPTHTGGPTVPPATPSVPPAVTSAAPCSTHQAPTTDRATSPAVTLLSTLRATSSPSATPGPVTSRATTSTSAGTNLTGTTHSTVTPVPNHSSAPTATPVSNPTSSPTATLVPNPSSAPTATHSTVTTVPNPTSPTPKPSCAHTATPVPHSSSAPTATHSTVTTVPNPTSPHTATPFSNPSSAATATPVPHPSSTPTATPVPHPSSVPTATPHTPTPIPSSTIPPQTSPGSSPAVPCQPSSPPSPAPSPKATPGSVPEPAQPTSNGHINLHPEPGSGSGSGSGSRLCSCLALLLAATMGSVLLGGLL